MKKTLKRDVVAACNRWGDDVQRWGENNLATVRSLGRYQAVRRSWEAEHGVDFYTRQPKS